MKTGHAISFVFVGWLTATHPVFCILLTLIFVGVGVFEDLVRARWLTFLVSE